MVVDKDNVEKPISTFSLGYKDDFSGGKWWGLS